MKKIAFMFSGQGAQYPGMMKDLYDVIPECRYVFDTADKTLGREIRELCFNGTQEDLDLTHNTQPCMLAADLAAYAALNTLGIKPCAVTGFSLGEYAALVAAGVISMEDAFSVIQIRADAMQKAVPVGVGAMAAIVGLDSDAVIRICNGVTDEYVIAANFNSSVQTVISGTTQGVASAMSIAQKEGATAIPLSVSAPFHCKLMKPAAAELGDALEKTAFHAPQVSVYMNCTALPLASAEATKELLIDQAYRPVLWKQTIENLFNAGCDTFIQCGAGKTLSGFAKKTLKGKSVTIARVENMKTLNEAEKILAE